jgi:hypothetical protein
MEKLLLLLLITPTLFAKPKFYYGDTVMLKKPTERFSFFKVQYGIVTDYWTNGAACHKYTYSVRFLIGDSFETKPYCEDELDKIKALKAK